MKKLKKETVYLFAISLVIYVLAILLTAPASLINARLQNISAGQLHLTEAQGTLWSGTGQIEMRDADGRHALAKKVQWHLQLKELLHLHLAYEVQLDSSSSFPLILSWSQLELANTDLSLPAEVIGFRLPKVAALGLTGDLLIHISKLSIRQNGIKGSATLQWRNAGSTLTPVSPLGDYTVYIKGEGPVVHLTLRTLQGPLQLDGKGTWQPGQPSDFLATARIAAPFLQQLTPLLRLIAVEHNDGSFALAVN